MKKIILLLIVFSFGFSTETIFAQDSILTKIECKKYYKHLKKCYGGKSGGDDVWTTQGEASLSFWKNNISVDWIERDSAGYPVFRTSRILYYNNAFRAFNSNALKNGPGDGVRTVPDLNDSYDLSFFEVLQGDCPNDYKQDLSHNNVLKKKQFAKTLAHFQKCYGQETGVVRLKTDAGNALVFFLEYEIRAMWKENTSDTTAISHIRSLYSDRYESKEYRHYIYQDDSLVGYINFRECFDKNDKYDKNFVTLLKSRECIPDMGIQLEVWSSNLER